MIALWSRRLWPYFSTLGVLLLLWLAIDGWRGRGGGADARAAHARSEAAERIVLRTDTLFRRDTVAYQVAVTRYRTLRDTLRVTDSLAVREGFRRADAAFARCDSLLASARTTIRARDTLIVRVQDEVAIASQSRSRLSARAIALYEPVTSTPAASLEGSLHLFGRLSLVTRGDQRFATGERPRGYVGIAIDF